VQPAVCIPTLLPFYTTLSCSVYKEKNEVQWSPVPLDALLDVDGIISYWCAVAVWTGNKLMLFCMNGIGMMCGVGTEQCLGARGWHHRLLMSGCCLACLLAAASCCRRACSLPWVAAVWLAYRRGLLLLPRACSAAPRCTTLPGPHLSQPSNQSTALPLDLVQGGAWHGGAPHAGAEAVSGPHAAGGGVPSLPCQGP